MPWLAGTTTGVLAILLSGIISGWVASNWAWVDLRLIMIAGLLPLVGFLVGYIPYAKGTDQWPVDFRGTRCLIGLLTGALCVMGAFQTFLMASHTWNARFLPPEKQSITYFVLRPWEVPSLRVTSTNPSTGAITESDQSWHSFAVFSFVMGAAGGYIGSGRGKA